MTTKRKHGKVALKAEYEALKEFDKNKHNEPAVRFNTPRSTLSTWNQPISTIVWVVIQMRLLGQF